MYVQENLSKLTRKTKTQKTGRPCIPDSELLCKIFFGFSKRSDFGLAKFLQKSICVGRDKMSYVQVLQLCWTLVYHSSQFTGWQQWIFTYDDCDYPGSLEFKVLFRSCLVLCVKLVVSDLHVSLNPSEIRILVMFRKGTFQLISFQQLSGPMGFIKFHVTTLMK